MKRKKLIFILFAILFLPIFNVSAIEKVSCGEITAIPRKIPELTQFAVTLIQIAVPIILVLRGSLDLFNGITSQKDEDIKKGQQKFIRRLIVAVIIFFVVVIVKFITSIVAGLNSDSAIDCIDCFISLDCDKYVGSNKKIDKETISTKEELNKNNTQKNETNKNNTSKKETNKSNNNKNNKQENKNNKTDKNEPNNKQNINSSKDNKKESLKNYSNLFVGDSRTVGMCNTYKLCEGYDYIAEIGKGYSWFINTAIPKINSKIKSQNYNIIILMGVNDVGSNGSSIATNYYNKIYDLAKTTWKNQNVIFVSVNPVRDGMSYAYMSGVNSFNSQMKSKINSSGLSNLKYCDTISSLYMSSIDSGDGLHYNKTGYSSIYNKIKSSCLK